MPLSSIRFTFGGQIEDEGRLKRHRHRVSSCAIFLIVNMAETYFITGAQGCIGSWIVKALAERGDTPVVFDRSEDTRRLGAIMERVHLERVRVIAGDITDVSAVRSALEASGARRIIHLAG